MAKNIFAFKIILMAMANRNFI